MYKKTFQSLNFQSNILLAILSVLILSNGSAQNLKEGINNTTQIKSGKATLKRDISELNTFQSKLNKFNKSFENKNPVMANIIKSDLIIDMQREVAQSSIKASQARKEIAQSQSEVRSDNRELRRDRKDSRRSHHDKKDDKKDIARDRANKRDDKRDLNDDIRDFKAQIARFDNQSSILKTMMKYDFSFKIKDDQNFKNKLLLNDFLRTLEADIEATRRELKEDKKERREDIRERKDDKNERKEKRRRRN